MFTSAMFTAILPEVLILVLGMLVLIVEPFWKEEKRRNVGRKTQRHAEHPNATDYSRAVPGDAFLEP